ncbi:MAG: GIY-YIG nuclease family protein [Rhizobiaceae bacterium]|nr:GIY-YIG nuclease family protein [Rhizobiaceae bacterium]
MNTIDRKAAAAAYKKRETIAGIYAIRSAAGGVWVGYARDIDAIQNRAWFSLRTGAHMSKSLQAAWNAEGEAAFSLEPLELVDADTLGFNPEKALRDRASGWREKLGAESA